MSNQVEAPDGEARAQDYLLVSEVVRQCAGRCREMHSSQHQRMQVLVEVFQSLRTGPEAWRGESARAFEVLGLAKVWGNFSGLALALQWGAETLEKVGQVLEARGEVRGQVERMQGQQSQPGGMTEQGLTQMMNLEATARWELVGLIGTLSEQLGEAAREVGACNTGTSGSGPFGGPGDWGMNQDRGSGGKEEPVPGGRSDPATGGRRTRMQQLFHFLLQLMRRYGVDWPEWPVFNVRKGAYSSIKNQDLAALLEVRDILFPPRYDPEYSEALATLSTFKDPLDLARKIEEMLVWQEEKDGSAYQTLSRLTIYYIREILKKSKLSEEESRYFSGLFERYKEEYSRARGITKAAVDGLFGIR